MTSVEILENAREDFNAFAELVGRDDGTGAAYVQAPHHKDWAERALAHDRLIIHPFVESGATSQLMILRTIWELGRDHRLRFLLLSNTLSQAIKVLQRIRELIASPMVKEIFPTLVEDEAPHARASESHKDKHLFIRGRRNERDTSVRVSAPGNMTSGRFDRLVLDMLCDWQNADTQEHCDRFLLWVQQYVFARLAPRARVIAIEGVFAHRTYVDQLFATDTDAGRWARSYYPVMEAAAPHAPVWPQIWPMSRIEQRIVDIASDEHFKQTMMLQRPGV